MPRGKIRFDRFSRCDYRDTECRGKTSTFASVFGGRGKVLCELHFMEVMDCEIILIKTSGEYIIENGLEIPDLTLKTISERVYD
jgi:hypothetical protein